MHALRDCAGVLQNNCHDAVLTTVLGIGLWRCSTVSCWGGGGAGSSRSVLQCTHTLARAC